MAFALPQGHILGERLSCGGGAARMMLRWARESGVGDENVRR